MNWNAKPEGAMLPPPYPNSQASFLQQALVNPLTSASPSPFNRSGGSLEACMYPRRANPGSQSLHVRTYETPQAPDPAVNNGAIVASQTSGERITYTNAQGHTQLSHNLQVPSGLTQNAWLSSAGRHPLLSHSGAAAPAQAALGTHGPSGQPQPSQLVTPDSYSTPLQVAPSDSVRVPGTYQGSQGLSPSFPERQVDWAQLCTSNGLTFPDYRPIPKQYCFPQQGYLQNPTIQKQNPVSSTPLQVKNSPNAVPSSQPPQVHNAPARSPYAATQPDSRRPLPGYDCRYASQPSQSSQRGVRQPSAEVPQNQEMHLSERRKDFCRGFQKQWLPPSEKVSMVGNLCNLKEHAIVNQPSREPLTSFVGGVQTLAQNNQDKRMDSSNPTSNQVLDTTATKENLVKDIEALIEMRRKFSELARKIKIKKDLLMAAGCNKTSNTSHSASAQNSELSLKQNAKTQCEPQGAPGTLEIAEDKPQRVIYSAVKTNTADEQSLPTNSVPQLEPFEESNYLNKNPLLFKLLVPKDKPQKKLLQDDSETILNPQITGNHPNMKTLETSDISDKSSDTSFCLEHKASTNGLSCQRDTRCMELLATCLSLWKRQPSELAEGKQCSESRISTTATGKPNPVDGTRGTSPGAVVGNSQKKAVNSQEAALPAVVQSYESSNTTKATELQIAIVPPLVLTVAKGITSQVLSETVYPVIKEGSVCSLQGELAESKSLTGSSKANMAGTTSATKIFPLTWEEKQNESTEDNLEGSPDASWGNQIKAEPDIRLPPSPGVTACPGTGDAQQVSWEPQASGPESGDTLQIASICSLVEGEMSYNSQIAEMFSSPSRRVEPQKPSPSVHPAISGGQGEEPPRCVAVNEGLPAERALESAVKEERGAGGSCSSLAALQQEIEALFSSSLKKVEPQKLSLSVPQVIISGGQEKEQFHKNTENKDAGFHRDGFVHSPEVSPKLAERPKAPRPPGSLASMRVDAGEGLGAEEATVENEGRAEGCRSPAALQQEIYLKTEASCGYRPRDPAGSGPRGNKAPAFSLRDQLSELLEEFPYGIEAAGLRRGSVGARAAEPAAGDAPAPTGTSREAGEPAPQIQITLLDSEQMRELFPEQGDPRCGGGSLAGPPEEQPAPQTALGEPEQDDVRCCALGWLSAVYERVPQCQCPALEASAAGGQGAPSPASARDEPGQPPDSSAKAPLMPPEKNGFPEREQGKSRKDRPRTKHSTLRRGEELPGQSLSKSDRKLDSLPSHKRNQKLKFHEVNFHSSNKRVKCYDPASQESPQKRHCALNLSSLKARPAVAANKDPHGKSGSSMQSVAPEKVKFKVGLSRYKLLEKRKIDQGATVDRQIKKKKFDEQEKNKNGGSTPKLCTALSHPNERASIKEKTVSLEAKFTDQEIHMQKNLMKSSSASSKPSDLKDTSCKINRVLISEECLQRQKHREAVDNKGPKNSCVAEKTKNGPVSSESTKPSKLPREADTCGTSNERDRSSGQASKESLHLANQAKNLKPHLSEDSKVHSASPSVKGRAGGKQPDKLCIDKIKLDRNLADIQVKFSQMPPQAKGQGKHYLNRVAFKCTERQSLYLTKLDGSPRKLNKGGEKSQEGEGKDGVPPGAPPATPGMLQFKLCPEGLLEGRAAGEEQEHTAGAAPEQAPVQVSGIKSTKEAWLKSVPLEKRLQEAQQEIDNSGLPNPRLSKRSTSAEGLETLQNPGKDSKAMFQTYRQMYMKRSRSFEHSPSE